MPTSSYPIRPCPACLSLKRAQLFTYTLSNGQLQTIYSCLPCGMIYCSVPSAVDYAHSIYEAPGAIGSGTNPTIRIGLNISLRGSKSSLL